MNIINYIFYRVYNSIYKVNKVYPEYTAIGYTLCLLNLNVFTLYFYLSKFLNASFTRNNFEHLLIIQIVFSSIVFYHYYRNDKWKSVVNFYQNKKVNIFIRTFALCYQSVTFFMFIKTMDVKSLDIIIYLVFLYLLDFLLDFILKKYF